MKGIDMEIDWDKEGVVKSVEEIAIWESCDGYINIAQKNMYEGDQIITFPKELANNLIVKLQMLVDE